MALPGRALESGSAKSGTGTMVITSDNSTGYQGVTDIQNGYLNIQNNNALGQSGTSFGDLHNSVQVDNGATQGQLQLQGPGGAATSGLTVSSDKTLVLNGGVGSADTSGALRNIAAGGNTTAQNTNTWNGRNHPWVDKPDQH